MLIIDRGVLVCDRCKRGTVIFGAIVACGPFTMRFHHDASRPAGWEIGPLHEATCPGCLEAIRRKGPPQVGVDPKMPDP